MSILVISTGGTIGALPHDDPSKAPATILIPEDKRDAVREYLIEVGVDASRYIDAGQRDSKLIDEPYRAMLQTLIEAASEDKILITHGTDTLLQTADFLFEHAKLSPKLGEKIIILTGSMVPLANGPESDGYANLTFALGLLTHGEIEPGIYIVLSDYEIPEDEQSWLPRLYPYMSGQYKKFYHPVDSRYNRLLSVKG